MNATAEYTSSEKVTPGMSLNTIEGIDAFFRLCLAKKGMNFNYNALLDQRLELMKKRDDKISHPVQKSVDWKNTSLDD